MQVVMDNAKQGFLHVSQNIPNNSPMEVTMKQPMNSQIHVSQAVPMSSSLTWKLDGDATVNQVHVSQNAADNNSALDCSPACPQKEGGEENGESGGSARKPSSGNKRNKKPSQRKQAKGGKQKGQDRPRRQNGKKNNKGRNGNIGSKNNLRKKTRGGGKNSAPGTKGKPNGCVGGSLNSCVEGCPGKFGARVFGACVKSCNKRC